MSDFCLFGFEMEFGMYNRWDGVLVCGFCEKPIEWVVELMRMTGDGFLFRNGF